MWRLCVVVASALFVVLAAEKPVAFVRELGPQAARLLAGEAPGQDADVPPTQRSIIISNRIRRFLEAYREDIANGNSIHPPLDPYQAEILGPYVVGTDAGILFRLTAQFNNLEVTGLNSFVTESLTFSLLRMNLSFRLTIPAIIAQTEYNAVARLALLARHRASGIARIIANDVIVDGFMQLAAVDGYLQASSLELDLKIGSTLVNLTEVTGVGVIDLVLNWVVQNVSSELIQQSTAEISEVVSNDLFVLVNQVLGRYTLDDLIG